MRRVLSGLNNRVLFLAAFLTAALVPSVAMADGTATTYDLSGATTSVVSQVTSVLGTALPVAGGLIALFVGWKLIKRMVKGA